MQPARIAIVLLSLLLPASPAQAIAAGNGDPPTASCHSLQLDDGSLANICIGEDDYFGDVCRAIDVYATRWQLPPGYFARLIWQESRFDPNALSRAGAEGIAQFMPGTGRLRGLDDAYDPTEALAKSAQYLSALRSRFGNLGLAAAAYNGGENRLARFVATGGTLPYETRDYVAIVTGRTVEDWLAPDPAPIDYALSQDLPFEAACLQMAEGRAPPSLQPPLDELLPWGVMLAQDFSEPVAVARFERMQGAYADLLGAEKLMLTRARNPNFGPRLRYIAMVGRQSQEEANALCAALRSAGGSCVVRKN